MKLIEKENCFLIEDFFDSGTIAGFTKPGLPGDVLRDIPRVFTSLKDFKIAYLKQIHSSIVHSIQKECFLEGDGLITNETNIVCVVRTADCMPLFLSSKALGVTGIIHMGWRSAKKGILNNINYDLKSFKAIAGLGMRQCCYKVGNEFLEYSEFNSFLKKDGNDLYFNPIDFIEKNLAARGLNKNNFLDLNICSLCSKEKFFSFRRDSTDFRTLSFIVRTK